MIVIFFVTLCCKLLVLFLQFAAMQECISYQKKDSSAPDNKSKTAFIPTVPTMRFSH